MLICIGAVSLIELDDVREMLAWDNSGFSGIM